MAEHDTEEEQIRAIKEWWKENGRSVIAGVVIGIGTLIGWKGWGVYQEQQAIEASDRYNNMRSAILAQDLDSVVVQAQELKDNYSSTPYAAWGALLLAKAKATKGETEAVIDNLQWANENAKQDTVKSLAAIRLARVYIATSEFAKAEQLLDQSFPEAYTSLYQELLGDLYAQRGNHDQAREAYDAAISAAEEADIEFLKMKRDNLGLSSKAEA
jgi:predicted negative regulator of RcsB-dependent stress response